MLVGIGGVVAVGAAAVYVLSRGSSSSSTETPDSVLGGAPPVRTDQQNSDATLGAVREGFGVIREGLGLVRERLAAGDDARATQQKMDAHEASGGTER